MNTKHKLYRNKAIALYERKSSPIKVALGVLCNLLAVIICYMLGVLLPYMDSVSVGAEQNASVSRAALSASLADNARPDEKKPRALFMPTSEESFYKRLCLVRSATDYIDFMVYDTYDDDGAKYFYTSLIAAADRGVTVRVLIDGKFGGMNGPLADLQSLLETYNNITVYRFNDYDFGRPSGLMTLLHDKVLIADGKTMIVGGANMGMSAYVNNYDAEVLLTDIADDACLAQARGYYERMLNSKFTKCVSAEKMRKRAKIDKDAQEKIKNKYIPQLNEYFSKFGKASGINENNYADGSVSVDKVTYLSNPISDNKKPPVILQAIFNLAESSKKTTIVTPYTLLTDKKIARLRAIAAKNDEFRLITNSLYNTRNAAYAHYHSTRKKFLSEDIQLYEFQAQNQLHAKMSVYDDRISVIGSFNMDERSAHIDTESVVVIDSAEFAATVKGYIDREFVGNSLRVGTNNEYMPSDTVTVGTVDGLKKFKYALLSVTSALINLL